MGEDGELVVCGGEDLGGGGGGVIVGEGGGVEVVVGGGGEVGVGGGVEVGVGGSAVFELAAIIFSGEDRSLLNSTLFRFVLLLALLLSVCRFSPRRRHLLSEVLVSEVLFLLLVSIQTSGSRTSSSVVAERAPRAKTTLNMLAALWLSGEESHLMIILPSCLEPSRPCKILTASLQSSLSRMMCGCLVSSSAVIA